LAVEGFHTGVGADLGCARCTTGTVSFGRFVFARWGAKVGAIMPSDETVFTEAMRAKKTFKSR
jgi:hypothetical protein